jgi:hypothetical protein
MGELLGQERLFEGSRHGPLLVVQHLRFFPAALEPLRDDGSDEHEDRPCAGDDPWQVGRQGSTEGSPGGDHQGQPTGAEGGGDRGVTMARQGVGGVGRQQLGRIRGPAKVDGVVKIREGRVSGDRGLPVRGQPGLGVHEEGASTGEVVLVAEAG